MSRYIFWVLIIDVFLLGWIGCQPISYPFYTISQLLTLLYFFIIFLAFPFIILVEKKMKVISTA
jgi:ubiquinol-cytochrome c reductase cytochrome b subunit